jgi:hypothetical protein
LRHGIQWTRREKIASKLRRRKAAKGKARIKRGFSIKSLLGTSVKLGFEAASNAIAHAQ